MLSESDFIAAAPPVKLGDDEIHLWIFPHCGSGGAATSATQRCLHETLAAYLGIESGDLCIERDDAGTAHRIRSLAIDVHAPWVDDVIDERHFTRAAADEHRKCAEPHAHASSLLAERRATMSKCSVLSSAPASARSEPALAPAARGPSPSAAPNRAARGKPFRACSFSCAGTRCTRNCPRGAPR